MPPATQGRRDRVAARLVAAGLALAACTAPPPEHPYWPFAAHDRLTYEGHQRDPDGVVSPRFAEVHVAEVTHPPGASAAEIYEEGLGAGGAQGTSVEAWIVTAAGLLPIGPPEAERDGVELPHDLTRARPWTHEVTWVSEGARSRTRGRSAVVGRRRITVPAGTFDTLVVRSELDLELPLGRGGANHHLSFVLVRDLACGVGLVRRVIQDGAGSGARLELEERRAAAVAAAATGCDPAGYAALPVHGADELLAAADRRCDVAALTAIGDELGDDPPADRRRAAFPRLVAACAGAVPPSIAAYLETGAEPLPYAREPEVERWLDETCPKRHILRTFGQSALTPELFDACELGRLGVVDRAELEGTEHPLLALALHRWFVATGVPPDPARALTRALLARERALDLLSADLALPAADLPVVHARPPLEVHRAEIRFADAHRPFRPHPRRDDDDPLFLALLRAAELERASAGATDPVLLIAADVDVAFMDLLDALSLAGEAGFDRRSLAVLRPDGRLGALDLAPAPLANTWDPELDPAPALIVEFTGSALTVRAHDVHAPERPREPLALADLHAHAEAFKARHPGAHRLVLTPAGTPSTTTVADIVPVLLALHDLFADIRLAHVAIWTRP